MGRPLQIRARVSDATNLWALGAAILVFSTGLLLLAQFHVGAGSLREPAIGQSRLWWVNLHRISALALVLVVAVHTQLHWRPISSQIGRALGTRPGEVSRADLLLYVGFAVVSATGLTAWLVVPGSPPLFGPVTLSRLASQREIWIDLHHMFGLIVLPAVIIHVRRRFRSILRTIGLRE